MVGRMCIHAIGYIERTDEVEVAAHAEELYSSSSPQIRSLKTSGTIAYHSETSKVGK